MENQNQEDKNILKLISFWITNGIVLAICVVTWWLLKHLITLEYDPLRIEKWSIFATILGLLAGGSIAGYFSFSYKDADKKEKWTTTAFAYGLIVSIFLLTFLAIYSLFKIGLFEFTGTFIDIVTFITIYLILDAIVLLEQWDRTYFPPV